MFKLFLFFVFLVTTAVAGDKVEVYATKMDTVGNTVYATGEVNVIYQDYFMSADEARYNKDSGDLELFGNIRVTKGDDYKILGEYARLNIKEKTREFKPFYMLEKKTNIWMSGKKSVACKGNLDIKSGLLSGCNPNKPFWKMKFSSSDYDEKSQWLNMYNTILYIYDIPVFYTPYFGYSLDTKRQSGLLMPSYGISATAGFYYQQSIYIALQNNWDLELKPQIRTLRGEGLYSQLRFVDSKVSSGSLKFGYFQEHQNYYELNKLKNKKHFGFDFRYSNNNFINQLFGTSLKGESSIYTNIHYLNDVSYRNLSTNNPAKISTAKQVRSRLNLFYNTPKNYYGTYLKYYIDLTKVNNDTTLQKLPTIQYHRYLDILLKNHLLYKFDLKSSNIYRYKGVKAIQTNLSLPITLQTSLFDQYLNVAYKSYIFAQTSNFNGQNGLSKVYNNGYFAKNYNLIQASTQLTHAYEEFSHTVSFGASYTFGSKTLRKGYYKDVQDECLVNPSDPKCDFYNVSNTAQSLNLDFKQYLFDRGGSRKLYHRLSQNIVYQGKTKSLGDLENELNYQVNPSLSLYNNMFFNYKEKLFSKIYNKLTYNAFGVNISLSHLFKDNFLKDKTGSQRYSSYMTSSLQYKYNEHYSYTAGLNYDLEATTKKTLQVGFMYKKRCWDFGLKYVENNRPVLSSSGNLYQRYLYFTIVLKPIMKPTAKANSAFTYRLPKVYKGP